MRERPILFSGPMVRAILEGRKTQTRRIMKPQPYRAETGTWFWSPNKNVHHVGDDGMFQFVVSSMSCPYGWRGDRLWVKETFAKPSDSGPHGRIEYRADHGKDSEVVRWTPSIFCTRTASRITLEVTAVRVERLQDIGEADAKAEGADIQKECVGGQWIICGPRVGSYREGYRWLWEKINGAGSWAENPWVWVVEFRRVAP